MKITEIKMYSILYTNMSPKNLGFNRSGIPPHASTHLVNLKLDKASDALKKKFKR